MGAVVPPVRRGGTAASHYAARRLAAAEILGWLSAARPARDQRTLTWALRTPFVV